MKLENQVTCKELSDRLKELKVKQESSFYWEQEVSNNYEWHITFGNGIDWEPSQMDNEYICSAFTVAELINMLTEYRTDSIIIPVGIIANAANYLAKEVINEKEREKKN